MKKNKNDITELGQVSSHESVPLMPRGRKPRVMYKKTTVTNP